MDEPHLAQDRLAEIASLEAFRPGFRDRLIGLFRAALDEHLPTCLDHSGTSRLHKQYAAHALKGAAAGIGALRLQQLALGYEQAAAGGGTGIPDAAPLQIEAAAVLALLEQWAAGAGPPLVPTPKAG